MSAGRGLRHGRENDAVTDSFRELDVVVVGAGLAGLYAHYRLRQLDQLEAESIRIFREVRLPKDLTGTVVPAWFDRLSHQLTDHRDHLSQVVPWITILPVPDCFPHLNVLDRIPTLQSLQAIKDSCKPVFNAYELEEHSADESRQTRSSRSAISSRSRR